MNDTIENINGQSTARRLYTKAIVGAGAATTAALGVAGVASAEPPEDPTGGAATSLQSGITTWVQTYGLPLLVALMVLGAVIAVLVKFARKARSQI